MDIEDKEDKTLQPEDMGIRQASVLYAFPGFWGAVGLLLLALAVQVFVLGVLQYVGYEIGVALVPHPLGLGLINVTSMAVVLLAGLMFTEQSWKSVLAINGFSLRHLVPGLFVIIGLHFVFSEVSNGVNWLFPPSESINEQIDLLLGGGEYVWMAAITVIVLAPLGEELVFRGVILNGLAARFSRGAALMLHSVLFAALHLNLWQAPAALATGLLLGWWRLNTQSILFCFLGHALMNGLGFVGGRLLPWEILGYNVQPPEGGAFQPLWMTGGGAALVFLGLVWLAIQFHALSHKKNG